MPISGQHITEVFKKAALSNQTHEYEQFNNSITRLGMTINRAKAAEKKKQLAAIRQEQKRRDVARMNFEMALDESLRKKR